MAIAPCSLIQPLKHLLRRIETPCAPRFPDRLIREAELATQVTAHLRGARDPSVETKRPSQLYVLSTVSVHHHLLDGSVQLQGTVAFTFHRSHRRASCF